MVTPVDPDTGTPFAGLTIYGEFASRLAQQTLTVTSAPTAEHTIRVWGVWRGSWTLMLTVACPDTYPEARWGAGWVNNPVEWRREIEHGAVDVYDRWKRAQEVAA